MIPLFQTENRLAQETFTKVLKDLMHGLIAWALQSWVKKIYQEDKKGLVCEPLGEKGPVLKKKKKKDPL